MTPILHLTLRSVRNRGLSVGLTLLTVALSVALLLGVERLRTETRASFANTIAGTDLIVGARSGPVQLLLYSVFRIGNATNNIRWQSVEMLREVPSVDWVVPISLGDSHRGFRVMGTTRDYFTHYRFAQQRPLALLEGRVFADTIDGVFEAVVGAEVARALGYRVGERIVLAHGAGAASLVEHADKPFTVVGILAPTGTPVDRSVHVSLAAIEAIHLDWVGGMPMPGLAIGPNEVRKFSLKPRQVTAAMVGLKSRATVFQVQRRVNDFRDEPLLAILPGATLQELWSLIGVAEKALLAVSALVVGVGLAGLVATMVAGLAERRRELAILRALGASPGQVFLLLASEAALVTLAGTLFGYALLCTAIVALGPWAAGQWGIVVSLEWPSPHEWTLLGAVLVASIAASCVPAWRAYRLSLSDGMMVRS